MTQPTPDGHHGGGCPPGGSTGDFEVRRDRSFWISFPLDAGPGFYFVVCHLRRGPLRDGPLVPATAVLIEARP